MNTIARADMNHPSRDQMDFYGCCESGSISRLQWHLEQGIDINFRHPDSGLSPLQISAIYVRTPIVKLLLHQGVNVNEVGVRKPNSTFNASWSSLLCAWDDHETVDLLLSHGADPDIQADDGMTILHYAADANRVDTVMLLLRHGARRDLADEEGLTPLQMAIAANSQDVVEAWQAYEAAEKAHLAIESGLAARPNAL